MGNVYIVDDGFGDFGIGFRILYLYKLFYGFCNYGVVVRFWEDDYVVNNVVFELR